MLNGGGDPGFWRSRIKQWQQHVFRGKREVTQCSGAPRRTYCRQDEQGKETLTSSLLKLAGSPAANQKLRPRLNFRTHESAFSSSALLSRHSVSLPANNLLTSKKWRLDEGGDILQGQKKKLSLVLSELIDQMSHFCSVLTVLSKVLDTSLLKCSA